MQLNNKIRLSLSVCCFFVWALLIRVVCTLGVGTKNTVTTLLAFAILLVSYIFFKKLSEYIWTNVDSFYATTEEDTSNNYAHRFAFAVLFISDFIYNPITHFITKTQMDFSSFVVGFILFWVGVYELRNIYKARKQYLADKSKQSN